MLILSINRIQHKKKIFIYIQLECEVLENDWFIAQYVLNTKFTQTTLKLQYGHKTMVDRRNSTGKRNQTQADFCARRQSQYVDDIGHEIVIGPPSLEIHYLLCTNGLHFEYF